MNADVTIALLTHQDIDSYIHMFSPLVQQKLHVTLVDDERAYLVRMLDEQTKKKAYVFGIYYQNMLVGSIHIRCGDTYRGNLYYWLNENYWGRGIFQCALTRVLIYFFSECDEKFLTARVDVDNKKSYHALKKIGFADYAKVMGPHGLQYELIIRKILAK